MRDLGTFWRIIRALWTSRKGGQSAAHVLRQTDAVMGAVGYEQGSGPVFSDDAINALSNPEWETLWQDDFKLTLAHIDLIKRAQLDWDDVESGAPMLDLEAPYRYGTTPEHLTRLLGEGGTEQEKVAFLLSMNQAFSTFCETAKIQAGTYDLDGVSINLTEDLIGLVRGMTWEWPDEDEMGIALYNGEVAGPRGDGKRPYGDMSFFALDIHRLLKWEVVSRSEEGFIEISDEQVQAANDLHDMILPALKVFLQNATVEEVAE